MAFTEKPLVYDYIKMVTLVDTFFPAICGCWVFILSGISGFYFYISLPEPLRKISVPVTGCRNVFPLCALHLCIIVPHDILNQTPLVPSCYQQLMPKIFVITLLSMQVRTLQITETEFPAIVLFLFCLLYSKKDAQCKEIYSKIMPW